MAGQTPQPPNEVTITGLALTPGRPPKTGSAPGIYDPGPVFADSYAVVVDKLPHVLRIGAIVELRVPPALFGEFSVSIHRTTSEENVPDGLSRLAMESVPIAEIPAHQTESRFPFCPLDIDVYVPQGGTVCFWAAVEGNVNPHIMKSLRVVTREDGW